MRLALLHCIPLLCLPFLAASQGITNLNAVQDGADVVITYTLSGDAGKAYLVTLYSSTDNFEKPLQLVEGDVGDKRILRGLREVRWHAEQELKTFNGEISFELRAAPAPPLFTQITTSAARVKKKEPVTIKWTGGDTSLPVTINLVKGDKVIPLGQTANNRSYSFTASRKGASTVQLAQGSEWTTGPSLKVAPKIKFIWKVAVLAGVGTAIYFLTKPEKEKEFPEPPDLTQ